LPVCDLIMREPDLERFRIDIIEELMLSFLLWCILLIMCWPLALVALVLYPLVWLVLLPFRIVGIAVGGVLELVRGIIFLPARVLRGRVRA
jgi:hypothetical protein